MNLLVLNGPNLNLLGSREPETYGTATLQDLETALKKAFPKVDFTFFQSNHEGALIDKLHETLDSSPHGIIFNPGAYTHTSIAIRDAIASIQTPVIEIHISNIHARESFRQHSLLAPVCLGQVCGLGLSGYFSAVSYFLHRTTWVLTTDPQAQ